MSLPAKPNNRKEAYLSKMAGQDTELPASPQNREEAYLDYIARNGGGGGGGGDVTKAYVDEQDAKKVDKIEGKGLSTNDYDDTAKSAVDNLSSALAAKANKNEMSVEAGTGADADKTTITLKENMSATVLNAHQDISGKADKVTTGTPNGKLASLDSNGNLADSGVMADMTSTPATGNPLSFTTDSAQVAQNTVITFEPIQAGSGDPSPTNERPIEGYIEAELVVPRKNLYDQSTLEQGSFNAQGKPQASDARIRTPFIPVESLTRYAVSLGDSNIVLYEVFEYDENKNYLVEHSYGTQSFDRTMGSTTKFFRFSLKKSDNSNLTPSDVTTLQMEKGETPTTYEPYNPLTDISEQLPTTIYGGTLDVESGELVVDRKAVDLSTLTWNHQYAPSHISNPIDNIKLPESNYDKCGLICSNKITSGRNTYGENCIYVGGDSTFVTYDESSTITGTAVYYLATPITYHLTPHQVKLLQGANTVTTNGTSISLTYRKGEVAKLSDLSGIAESVEGLGEICKAIPEAPTTDGTYTLKVTVSSGAPTYAWTADT